MKHLLTALMALCSQVMYSSAGKLIPDAVPLLSAGNVIDKGQRPMSVIPDPRNQTLLIAVRRDTEIWTLSTDTLDYVSQLCGNVDGYQSNVIIGEAHLNKPAAVFTMSSKEFGIVDYENRCIRKASYQDGDDDYFVTDIAGLCTGNVLDKPRDAMRQPNRENILFIIFESNDIKKWDTDANVEVETISMPNTVLGAAFSNNYEALYAVSWSGNTLKGTRVHTQTSVKEEMFAIATTKNLQQVMDGGLSSDQTKVMADTNEAWKADVVRIGEHLLIDAMNNGYGLVDIDMSCETAYTILFGTTDDKLGPAIYATPNKIYNYVEDRMQMFSVSQCAAEGRLMNKPIYTLNNWQRKSNHSCAEIDDHQIGDDITLEGMTCGGELVTSCYTQCSALCQDEATCVAFQCDYNTMKCKLSACAAVSPDGTPGVTCYGYSDVLASPPAI